MAIAPTRTDAQLVRRLQARDRDAWEQLYAEYHPRLRAFGYRLAGNAHDADDLAQETFVRALPALDRLDPDTTDLTAYLFATTKNLFLKQVEKGKRAEPTAEVPEPDLPTAIDDDPERSTLLGRQQEEVRLANARLDPRQRLVLALCELEDRSYAEIGELVGLNENAVAQLVFRARERLRTELRLVQVDPESFPETCRAFLPLLAQHLDGKLRGPKLEETLAHLEECERCQAALGDMREAKRRYRALLLPPLGMPAEEARAAVERDLDEVGYWRGGGAQAALLRRPRGAAAVAATLAAGALLCLAGGLGAAVLLVDRDPAATPRAALTTQPSTEPLETTAAASPPPPTAVPTKTTSSQPSTKAKPPSEPKRAQKATAAKPTPTTPQAVSTGAEKPVATPSPPPPPSKPPPSKPPPKVSPPPPPPTVTGDGPPRDTTAPTVTITSAPNASTSETTAGLAFTSSEPRVTFSCRLDGGGWEPCTSPRGLTALTLGAHTFDVRATDTAGNVGTPATRRWTVTPPPDTTAPTVALTQTPPASTTSRSATFAFAADEPGVTFACSYDSGPFASCASPHSIADVGADDHTFAVRATDGAGNTGSAATARWVVVVPLPDLVASLTATSVTVRNTGEGAAGPSLVTVLGVGTFTIPALPPGQSVTNTYRCVRGTITATADYARAVAESDETNNVATRVVSCLGLGS